MTKPTPPLKTYKGTCHCGAFKFSILIPELTSVTECNCSICFRKGYKWIYPATGFMVEKGDVDKSLKEYRFASGVMVHKFCPTCGTGILGKMNKTGLEGDVEVNARALQDVDLWALEVKTFDGAAVKPAYVPHLYTGPEPGMEIEGGKVYTGSCHCGAVTMALKTKGPLHKEEEVIGECDCSICARHGRVLTYRPPSQISVYLAPGIELSSYAFGTKTYEHKFCPVCGVAVGVDDVEDNMKAVNLRCFEGMEWADIETWKEPGSKNGEMYVVPD